MRIIEALPEEYILWPDQMVVDTPVEPGDICPSCDGEGWLEDEGCPCPVCGGFGELKDAKE